MNIAQPNFSLLRKNFKFNPLLVFHIRENTLQLDKVLKPFPKVKLSGKLEIDAIVRLESGKLSELKYFEKSQFYN